MIATDATVVPLADICGRYLNMGRDAAMKAASLNQLPFPTFRLVDSKRAPVLVSVADLQHVIEIRRVCAMENWTNSQV